MHRQYFHAAGEWLNYRRLMVAKIGPDDLPFDPMQNQIGQLDTAIEMKLIIEEWKENECGMTYGK